jgi:uncharacterized protein YjlB
MTGEFFVYRPALTGRAARRAATVIAPVWTILWTGGLLDYY